MKEPILQNTRKLVLTANRAEHPSYDADYLRSMYSFKEEEQDYDFGGPLNWEVKRLQCSPRSAATHRLSYEAKFWFKF